ncbi:glycine-rich protein [Polluticoccus soli]|uniref:glycine-rich protein n=1 Tax=Polluticoccus soli TaxID=3034150 RepID=UPI0023E30C17|nr:glycine-rich protein [Flavipsychrobacter sp. JY13-12]
MKKNYTRPVFLILLLFMVACPAICGIGFAQQVTTFSFINGVQTYTVPVGVTFLDVKVRGAIGGAGTGTGAAAGGGGSEVTGRLAVSPGTVLYIYVGSAGTAFSGGFNGGGTPGTSGGGGGGASDIRIGGTTTSNRVIVAAGGGGGGGGSATGYIGGGGGSTTGVGQDGAPSATLGGKGGTQAIGGPGGGSSCSGGTTTAGSMGSFGQGANAVGNGGGGGGGFFGGGSGATNTGGTCVTGAGGGGGGSSMVSTSVVSNYAITTGTINTNGSVEITTPLAPSVTTTGVTVSSPNYTLEGIVTANGATVTASFEYSNSPGLSSGVFTVSASQNPIAANAVNTTATATIAGLIANTTYYYRIKGQNSVGTVNGAILSFTTPNTAPKPISGNLQNITMCQNSKDYQLTALLHVNDTDPAQSITWSVAAMPYKNGSLGGFSSSNTSVAGSANITPGNAISYTPITGFKGNDTFKIQISDGKASDTITFVATVNPLPAPIITRNGLQLSTGAFDIYQWYRNNIAVIGATTQDYTMTEGGEYHVTVTDVNGCSATSNLYKYPTVSVDEVEAPAIHAYPNPVLHVLHVDAPDGSNLSITGMDGKLAIAQAAGRVDVSALVPGVYVLRIYNATGNLLQTSKLIRTAE